MHSSHETFPPHIEPAVLWSNVPQKFFDLLKSSNFCAPLKPSFVWFTTEHGESGESKAVTSLRERKLRLSQSGLLLCASVEAFLPDKFFAGASQSTDFCFYQQYLLLSRVLKMSFDSEDSEIYYIAEENDDSHLSTTQSE